MTLRPAHYTPYEGSVWHAWIKRDVNINDLQQRDEYNIVLEDSMVHSLLFTIAVSGFAGRWDCINGWTY